MEPITFVGFPKIARLNRDIVVTEKIDGTNAQIYVNEAGELLAGSRTRWIYPGKEDNYGFAGWVERNADELRKLGPGHHFGEWWGAGIQRRYDLPEKRFSLFNTARWAGTNSAAPGVVDLVANSGGPGCCYVVPVLYCGPFGTHEIYAALRGLEHYGSTAAPGFMKPEGIVVYHTAANIPFKVTLENDSQPKGSR